MKKLFYSEVLHKTFDSEDECVKAETEHLEKIDAEKKRKEEFATARKARAKEVEDAYKKVMDALKEYEELKKNFIKDYKSWHCSFTSSGFSLNDLFNDMFRVF